MAAHDLDAATLRAAYLAARVRHNLATEAECVEFLALPKVERAAVSAEPRSFEAFMSLCESDGERRILAELLRVGLPRLERGLLLVADLDGEHHIVEPQRRIGRSRTDIAIFTETRSLAVECDGWHFHEATPRMAADTKRRARELVGHGWTPVHFGYIEIETDVTGCVNELRALMCSPELP